MHTEIKLLSSNCLLKSQFVIQKASTVMDLHCATHPREDNNIAAAISFIC